LHSDETRFWNVNDGAVITTDTLGTNLDSLIVLQANVGTGGVLTQNYGFNILGQKRIPTGEDAGLVDIHEVYAIPEDDDGDGFPDDIDLAYLFDSDSYVYFNRESTNDPWVFQTVSQDIDPATEWDTDQGNLPAERLWKRENGKEDINFAWFHRTPRYHLIDPAPANIVDMYIITRGYARNLRLWLDDQLTNEPLAPTPFQLRGDYQELLDNKMISDTVILHSGTIKILFGPKADTEVQAIIKVIRSSDRSLSTNQIKTAIVDAVISFFDITLWEFGETFYFSELATTIHSALPTALDSVVLVPTLNTNEFGDLYQVLSKEDEIIQVDFSVDQVEIVSSLDSRTLRQ
jgi:hypothetical protein